MNSLVSVVIPTYNNGELLVETVLNVLGQTYLNLEVIVVNDGSTDDTEKTIINLILTDKRLNLISIKNAGSSNARNVGITRASGEYICFMDGDDLWPENKIELQLEVLENNSNSLVIGDVRRFYFEDNVRLWAGITKPPGDPNSQQYIDALLCMDGTQMSSYTTVMGKTAIIKKFGLYDPEFQTAEDWDCWVRLAHNNVFYHMDSVLLYYRKHKQSTTKKQPLEHAIKNQFKVIDREWALGRISTRKWLEYRRVRFFKFINIYLFDGEIAKSLFLFYRALLGSNMILSLDFIRYFSRLSKRLLKCTFKR